ncbi:MAG: thioredoxin family protein [Gemmatimonadota bacterium]
MADEFDYRRYWKAGLSWNEFRSGGIRKNRELWEGVYRKTRIPDWAVERMTELGVHVRLLVIAEDWCGDAANTVPLFVRFSEAVPGLELRIVKRDEHPELMDRHLTNGSRSIPIVIALDASDEPMAVWGPRPAELQKFVIGEKQAGSRPTGDIYRDARRWYARDRGETTLREFLDCIAAPVATGG